MKQFNQLIDRIIQRVNVNLRELDFDAEPYVRHLIPIDQFCKFYAFYGITQHHPLNFFFGNACLAGSYFLGKCHIENAILYKSDIRGDELKKMNDVVRSDGFTICLKDDEQIKIEDSFLVKTLVHNFSHDPEEPENFSIQNTFAAHYANIHGAPTEGSFLGPFATVDLTTVHDCVIGAYAYIQAGEVTHLNIGPGTIWVRSPDTFNFLYRFPRPVLDDYIRFNDARHPAGILLDFVEQRKEDFQKVFAVMHRDAPIQVPPGASLDRYAVVKAGSTISENVLVAQRAYLENAHLGKGANAQENTYLIDTRLEGLNITAHGAKIIRADMGTKVFVGFNAFLRGQPDARLSIGANSIVMPHTIIDIDQPVAIPEGHLVWGLIRSPEDVTTHTFPIDQFARIEDGLIQGDLLFEGSGAAFIDAFKHRIDHILAANGAFFDGHSGRGHAQHNRNISFNTIQPYPDGDGKGLYPTIEIRP